MCPHKRAFVLEHGIVGDDPNTGNLYVSCKPLPPFQICTTEQRPSGPMHKRNFSLTSGACLNDNNFSILTFDVKVEDGSDDISVLLPDPEDLDQVIATGRWMVKRDTAKAIDGEDQDIGGIEIVGPPEGKDADAQAGGCASGPVCGDSKLDW